MSAPAGEKPKVKAADIQVLRCLNPECRGIMGYEVTGDNVLYVDLHWQAEVDGDLRYFPCPKCGGRNVVEAHVDDKGRQTHRVTRFVAGGARP
jgi:hypothetical protein